MTEAEAFNDTNQDVKSECNIRGISNNPGITDTLSKNEENNSDQSTKTREAPNLFATEKNDDGDINGVNVTEVFSDTNQEVKPKCDIRDISDHQGIADTFSKNEENYSNQSTETRDISNLSAVEKDDDSDNKVYVTEAEVFNDTNQDVKSECVIRGISNHQGIADTFSTNEENYSNQATETREISNLSAVEKNGDSDNKVYVTEAEVFNDTNQDVKSECDIRGISNNPGIMDTLSKNEENNSDQSTKTRETSNLFATEKNDDGDINGVNVTVTEVFSDTNQEVKPKCDIRDISDHQEIADTFSTNEENYSNQSTGTRDISNLSAVEKNDDTDNKVYVTEAEVFNDTNQDVKSECDIRGISNNPGIMDTLSRNEENNSDQSTKTRETSKLFATKKNDDIDNGVNVTVTEVFSDTNKEVKTECDIRDISDHQGIADIFSTNEENYSNQATETKEISNLSAMEKNDDSDNGAYVIEAEVVGGGTNYDGKIECDIRSISDNQGITDALSRNRDNNSDQLTRTTETSNLCAREIHKNNVDVDEALRNIEIAKNCWNELETGPQNSGKSSEIFNRVIDNEEAVKYYIEEQFGLSADTYSSSTSSNNICSALFMVFFPNRLASSLYPSREFIFKLASTTFDEQNPVCLQSLKTIYKKIIGTQINCPRYGDHWSRLGFQGNDPATDLRGCGMFGLLQILNLCSSANFDICKEIYKLSHHHVQNFPFALVSINISSFVLQALRNNTLNKTLNKYDNLKEDKILNFFMEVCQFHAAVFWYFCKIWKEQGKTMADSGFVLDDLKKYTLKNSQKLMSDYKKSPRSFVGGSQCLEKNRTVIQESNQSKPGEEDSYRRTLA
ncbi:ELMO domain-containing protein 3 [Nymphon striatum]|nr:ELMO domain-containing protein 3 [Nymphon striatum]